ncbi:MAG: ABC transporter permease [Acidimicrobiia bacterium]
MARAPADRAARRRLGVPFWIAVGWVVLIVALAVLAPILPLADPNEVFNGDLSQGLFSGHNLLGTDDAGRDLLSRTIWGSRVSLLVGFASITLGLLVGGLTGIVAGYRRGWFDRIASAVYDVELAFPAVVLAVLLLTFLGKELQWVLLVIGVLAIAPIGRLARANTIAFANREFVIAAKGLGATEARTLWREILPNVITALTGLALLGAALAIVAEGGLAYLGLSVGGDTITWGKLISTASSGTTLRDTPLMAFVPITALLLTIFAINFIGDRLRAHFQVREVFGAS